MFSVFTNIYKKKTEGLTLMELFTAAGKQKKVFFFDNAVMIRAYDPCLKARIITGVKNIDASMLMRVWQEL
jgi:hypothetical protein